MCMAPLLERFVGSALVLVQGEEDVDAKILRLRDAFENSAVHADGLRRVAALRSAPSGKFAGVLQVRASSPSQFPAA